MSKLGNLVRKSEQAYKEEGAYWLYTKGRNVFRDRLISPIRWHLSGKKPSQKELENRFFDVVFINGCDYSVPHPIRYRVDHQMEQLTAAGFTCLKVEAGDVGDDLLRMGRMFIIFRCPYTDAIGEFITNAKRLNKRVFYDIDDLVIDTEYTDTIPFVGQMSPDERALYDDGVIRMGKTLSLCDGAITSTEGLAEELKKYVPKVYVNRNNASDFMFKLSEDAIYRRDVLPYLDENQIPKHYKRIQKTWQNYCASKDIVIGYFSGSITHNADFELVIPCLKKLLGEYSHLKLMIVGELAVPDELNEYQDRLIVMPFGSWRQLPFYIARCDINIAPSVDTIFNRAKSENKWVEASLVKVPTVASDMGAFSYSIEDGQTGLLAKDSDEWYTKLKYLIDNPNQRAKIGEEAYRFCKFHRVTVYNTENIRNIIENALSPNIGFLLPGLEIRGGVLVALKHGAILQNAGFDVTYIPLQDDGKWIEYEGHRFPVLDRLASYGEIEECRFYGRFDKLVATLWDTLDFALRYDKVKEVIYFVQNFEIDFYSPGSPLRVEASKTYQNVSGVKYITISKWCQNWLKESYGVDAHYVPNGLDISRFFPEKRNFDSEKIRILIEGDCGSDYKNVDEAFKIIDQLDRDLFEIWYMCYTGKTKGFYKIDKNLGSVPQEQVADIYRDCHILLKTSKLESFSYPPLEMMATGGIVVVAPNAGNIEYIVNGLNCLTYELGDIEKAKELIEDVVTNQSVRETLYEGGLETARKRDWKSIEKQILAVYE